jgi:hypothetical protein
MVDAPRAAGGQMGAAAAGLRYGACIHERLCRQNFGTRFEEHVEWRSGARPVEMRLGRGPISLSGGAFIGTAHLL